MTPMQGQNCVLRPIKPSRNIGKLGKFAVSEYPTTGSSTSKKFVKLVWRLPLSTRLSCTHSASKSPSSNIVANMISWLKLTVHLSGVKWIIPCSRRWRRSTTETLLMSSYAGPCKTDSFHCRSPPPQLVSTPIRKCMTLNWTRTI